MQIVVDRQRKDSPIVSFSNLDGQVATNAQLNPAATRPGMAMRLEVALHLRCATSRISQWRELLFGGKVRQGLSPDVRAKRFEVRRPCLTNQSLFDNLPTSRTSRFGEGITADEMEELCWLKPKLVAQTGFTEWTKYGLLRHATKVCATIQNRATWFVK